MQPWDPRSHQSTSAKSAPALTHATKTTNTKAAIPKLIVRLPDSALVLAKHERRLDEVGEARELLLAEHRLHEAKMRSDAAADATSEKMIRAAFAHAGNLRWLRRQNLSTSSVNSATSAWFMGAQLRAATKYLGSSFLRSRICGAQ